MSINIKQLLICAFVSCFSLCFFGGIIYANEIDSTYVTAGGSTLYPDVTTVISIHNTEVTTKENTLGVSNFNILVSNDDMFTGLEILLDTYTTKEYAPNMTPETKLALTKVLTSLVISVVTGDGSYTLETFKEAFIEILMQYGIEVTEDVVDAIVKYATKYLDSEFEQDDNEALLVWIGSSLGLMTTLFITSQQGGVHRA